MASEALASLTEIYTDSEGEEFSSYTDIREDIRKQIAKENNKKVTSTAVSSSNVRTTLVSYLDDTILSDDEPSEKLSDSLNSSVNLVTITSPPINNSIIIDNSVIDETNGIPKEVLPVFTDVEMPPEPLGTCSSELQQKITNLTEKMNTRKADMNQIIQERKSFRNPSIYEKLIQFCNINEFGTNYEPRIYDPLKWNASSYYDELSKLQRQDMDQREKERKERSKLTAGKRFQVEFVMGTAKKPANGASVTEDDSKKRKSKWDQVGIYTAQGIVKPPTGIMTLTSSATGTKGTVISAFGSFLKKPKV